MGNRKIEEDETVRMRCCLLEMGGWVGGWVGGWDVPQEVGGELTLVHRDSALVVDCFVQGLGWVGGWVGG